jgi:ArsR family transcriptional regulator, lead/cadmium/zinc/bismuth-responsive transcriptional repressor
MTPLTATNSATHTCPCGCEDGERTCVALVGLIGQVSAGRLAAVFKVLSDPARLRIVSVLMTGEICVNGLAAALGMSQSAVSHQLSDMRAARLVRARREGRFVFYSLDDAHVRDLFSQALAHVEHE